MVLSYISIYFKKLEAKKLFGDHRFFFVLGIGGSGTQWCAATFTTEHSFCFHEASNAMNRGRKKEFTHYRLLKDPNQLNALWRLEQFIKGMFNPMLKRMASRTEERVGNSDQFVSYFCDAMARLNPNWKFLFVIRDGIKSVERFYRTFPWRPYQYFDSLFVENWDELTDFEKCCYRWQVRNKVIWERIQQVSSSQWRWVTLERLTGDMEALEDVWHWLGLKDWDLYRERNMQYQKTRISRHKDAPNLKDSATIWSQWTEEQRDTFLRICGPDMAFYGFKIPHHE